MKHSTKMLSTAICNTMSMSVLTTFRNVASSKTQSNASTKKVQAQYQRIDQIVAAEPVASCRLSAWFPSPCVHKASIMGNRPAALRHVMGTGVLCTESGVERSSASWSRTTKGDTGRAFSMTKSGDAPNAPLWRRVETISEVLKNARTIQDVDRISIRGELTVEQVAQAYQALKRIYLTDPSRESKQKAEGVMHILSERFIEQIKYVNPRHICFLLGAHAHMRIHLGQMLASHITTAIKYKINAFNAQAISNTMWAFATLAMHPGDIHKVVTGLGLQAVIVSGDFNAQEIANTLWAFAKLKIKPDYKVIEALSQQAEYVTEFKPQSLSNTLWAFATMGIMPGNALRDVLFNHIVRTSDQFSTQALSNTFWSLALLNLQPGHYVVSALLGKLVLVSPQLNARELSSIIWALSKLRLELKDDVVNLLCRRIVPCAQTLNSQQISTIMWGMANHRKFQPENDVFQAVSRQILVTSNEFNAQAVSNTIWAFAKLGVHPGEQVLGALCKQAALISHNLTVQGISNTFWGLAKFGNKPEEELLASLCQQAMRVHAGFSSQSVSNVLWSLATLGVRPSEECLDMLFRVALPFCKDIPYEHLRQLHQAILYFVELQADKAPPQSALDLQAAIGEHCRSCFRAVTPETRATTKDSVFELMVNLGFKCELNFAEPVTNYTVDIHVEDGSDKGIAVEVDMPFNFVTLADDGKYKLSGPTMAKRKILATVGYKVVAIPFYEWSKQIQDATSEEYLRKLLQSPVQS